LTRFPNRFVLTISLTACTAACLAEDLSVWPAAPPKDSTAADGGPRRMVYRYLQNLADPLFARRTAELDKLSGTGQIAAYQRRLKEYFVQQLGGWPERTPLNARVVGRIERDGYRVEKVTFESRPGMIVTGALFLPATPGPFPGVIVPCGHYAEGKASPDYQRACMLLARNGIAALIYDPVGQGERYQILSPDGKPIYDATTEHTVLGTGCILLGLNTAGYRIWDGMRAIDYLCSREDIDSKRIGCTGHSGGGTLTSYLMALDDRIICAAPSCYLTGLERLTDTIGPQDAEQNIHGQIAAGMDHGDYLLMRAPRPTLMLATTGDFFDITGVWQVQREANRLYSRMGYPERVTIAEADGPHKFCKTSREAMARWMRRWLLDVDEPVNEPEPEPVVLTPAEIQCTSSGQVLREEAARSAFEYNRRLAQQLGAQRTRLKSETSRDRMLEQVRAVCGIRSFADLPSAESSLVGSLQRLSYRIDKLVLRPEKGIELPALAFVPQKGGSEATLYLHGGGKHVDAQPGGPIEKLVKAGHYVLAVDMRGIGEIAATDAYKGFVEQFSPNWKEFFFAYLLGKSFVGMRTEDVVQCGRLLAEKAERLHLVAIGECVVPAVHAAALKPGRFASVRLEDMPPSWSELIERPGHKQQLMNVVHGALNVYDWPDLITLLPEGKLQRPVRQE
jgi:dienelactone hydrolase